MTEQQRRIKAFLEVIRDERMTHANTATRIGNALIMLLEYFLSTDAPFLRKDMADGTDFLLTLLGGAVIGESNNIRLNPDGSITCGSIFVEGSAIFTELVFNHQNVLEGDTYFTDRGIIENVEFLGDGEYRLYMRKVHDNDTIPFHVNDVLRSAVNNLDTARTYRTTWMRVNSVDTVSNSMTVVMYAGTDVQGGTNYPPSAAARVVRWGNSLDPDRQNVFFVSSNDGRFLFLQGVTKPIIDDTNYSAFIGVPPDLECLRDLPINKRHPYLYARGLIVQDIIKIDYQGNPIYTPRDCGPWDPERVYIHGYDSTAQGYFTDRVWYGGCLWQCSVDRTTAGLAPRYNNPQWTCLLGGANVTFEIVSTNGDFFRYGSSWTTTLMARLWNAEMLLTLEDIGQANVTWERISSDTAGDAVWKLQHANAGLSVDISSDSDIPGGWGPGSDLAFRCTITIPELGTYVNEYPIEL